jgi:hypothetical protein
MKTFSTFISLLFILLAIQDGMSQTYTDDQGELSDRELVQSNNMTANIFQALGINNQTNTRNLEVSGNSINLRQIGEYNQVNIKGSTNASDINIRQNGDYNLTSLEYKVNTAVTDLSQNGDSNVIKDYVYNSSEDIFLNLQQDGDNLYFERFGSNNLTKSLQFKQTEASPTIIIRSF